MLYRHGDVLIEGIDELPGTKRKLQHVTLAHGEITGHSHRIQDISTAQLFDTPNVGLVLNVTAKQAVVIHEEHGDITLPQGYYRVWRQREYSPTEIRIIRD